MLPCVLQDWPTVYCTPDLAPHQNTAKYTSPTTHDARVVGRRLSYIYVEIEQGTSAFVADVKTRQRIRQSRKMSKLRSTPCRYFTGTGRCRYGASCHFSHDALLRHRPPVARTPCFHWEESGACPHGRHCAYLHRELPTRVSMEADLGAKLHVFERTALTERKQYDAMLSGFRELSSYSWLQSETPSIVVPGRFQR